MPAPIKTRERITCAAVRVNALAVVPIKINELPMDEYNRILKQHPGMLSTDAETGFITTHGRYVDEREAWRIAVEAGQVDQTRTAGTLCVLDLWDFWKRA